MYSLKAAYFDENVGAPWAAAKYGPDEMDKLNRLFQYTGPLRGLRILEPGCGTGRLTEILSDRVGEAGSVVALDISPGMIEEARRRIDKRENVEIHLCAMEDFPLEENSYDLILCHQVFPHFEDKERILTIFWRALKINSRLIVIHFINFEEINELHRKAGTAVEADVMPGEMDMRRLFDDSGLDVEFILDDHLGYLLSALRKH